MTALKSILRAVLASIRRLYTVTVFTNSEIFFKNERLHLQYEYVILKMWNEFCGIQQRRGAIIR